MTSDQTEESNTDATTEPDPESPEAQAAAEAATARADRADAGAAGDGPDEPVETRQERRDGRWRERAQTAEARIEHMQRAEVARLLAERVTDAEAALTLSNAAMADLLDEDGNVNPNAVQELADEVAEQRPYLRKTPTHHADIGPRRPPGQSSSPSWGRLLKGG